ncbi:MAG: DUF3786 domain-containing protein [Planctomycetota bacterium]|jgi:hypothetical protein
MSQDDCRRKAPGPPPQENLARATELGFEALGQQSDHQLLWLGAERADGNWRLAVLEGSLAIDPATRRVTTAEGGDVGPAWRILALHYLGIAARPERQIPRITFADLSTARSYDSVYQGRVIGRLCGTAGRNAETLTAAAEALGGTPVDAGDLAFDFRVFPRLRVRLIWHAPDEEFPPSATLLMPPNVEELFCSEDVVVLSECLVARLGGRPF